MTDEPADASDPVPAGVRTLPGALLTYPAAGEPETVAYGRFTVEAVPDGPVRPG